MTCRSVWILVAVLFCSTTCSAWEQGSFHLGAKVGTPQIAAVSVAYFPLSAWFLQFEPGIGGGKLSLGFGGVEDKYGLAIKASALQTWGWPVSGVETGQTYAGGEIELMFNRISLSLGTYGHVAGDDPDRDILISVGIGYGF